MGFTDKVEIVRKIMESHPKNARKKLAEFFGYEKGASEAKGKLTVHMRLAGLPEDVRDLVKECERRFDQKNPLSQATIRGILWKPRTEMMTALTTLRDNGLKAFKAYLKTLKTGSVIEAEETTSTTKSSPGDVKIAKLQKQVKDLQAKCKALEDKVHMLEAENEKLRHDEDSEDIISPTPNISFANDNNGDDGGVDSGDDGGVDSGDDGGVDSGDDGGDKNDDEKENTFMESLSLSKRVSSQSSTSLPQAKRRKLTCLPILPQREDFEEGEMVKALWDDGIWYDAKILKTFKNGKFRIQFTVDQVKKVYGTDRVRKLS